MTDDSAPVTETSETAPAKKRKGWPKGRRRKFRPVENVSRAREVSVERPPMREEAFVYKPEEDDDRLYVPRDIIPPGMDYQWVTCKIYGRPEPQRLDARCTCSCARLEYRGRHLDGGSRLRRNWRRVLVDPEPHAGACRGSCVTLTVYLTVQLCLRSRKDNEIGADTVE